MPACAGTAVVWSAVLVRPMLRLDPEAPGELAKCPSSVSKLSRMVGAACPKDATPPSTVTAKQTRLRSLIPSPSATTDEDMARIVGRFHTASVTRADTTGRGVAA